MRLLIKVQNTETKFKSNDVTQRRWWCWKRIIGEIFPKADLHIYDIAGADVAVLNSHLLVSIVASSALVWSISYCTALTWEVGVWGRGFTLTCEESVLWVAIVERNSSFHTKKCDSASKCRCHGIVHRCQLLIASRDLLIAWSPYPTTQYLCSIWPEWVWWCLCQLQHSCETAMTNDHWPSMDRWRWRVITNHMIKTRIQSPELGPPLFICVWFIAALCLVCVCCHQIKVSPSLLIQSHDLHSQFTITLV